MAADGVTDVLTATSSDYSMPTTKATDFAGNLRHGARAGRGKICRRIVHMYYKPSEGGIDGVLG